MITNDEPGSEPESHTHHQADNIQSLRFDNFFYVWSSTIVKCCVYLCKSVDCDCGWVLLLCCASLQLFPPRMFAEHNWMHITCADLFCIHLSPAQPSPASPAVGNICWHCSTCAQALPGGAVSQVQPVHGVQIGEMGRAAVLHSIHTIYMAAVCNGLRRNINIYKKYSDRR